MLSSFFADGCSEVIARGAADPSFDSSGSAFATKKRQTLPVSRSWG